jgi:hypothetical protein
LKVSKSFAMSDRRHNKEMQQTKATTEWRIGHRC